MIDVGFREGALAISEDDLSIARLRNRWTAVAISWACSGPSVCAKVSIHLSRCSSPREYSPLSCSSSAATEKFPLKDDGGRYKSEFSPQPMLSGIRNQHSIRCEWRVAWCAKSLHEAMNWRDSVVSINPPHILVRPLIEHMVPEIDKYTVLKL